MRIANAVATELDKIAADNGVTIEYDITSGQNDQTILKQLSDQAIADQVDAYHSHHDDHRADLCPLR